MTVKLTIDGIALEAEKGTTLLENAEKAGIKIPTFCHHKALEPFGACRLCVVEATKGNRTRVVTSCNYPVEDGLAVATNTARLLKHRRMLAELLLARCPDVPAVKDLAAGMGVAETRFKKENKDCILCGLCVRVCREVIGVSAIDFVNRGTDEEIDSPFSAEPDACIGCIACAAVCPTGAITVEEDGAGRKYPRWHASLKMETCRYCGKPVAPAVQVAYLKNKVNLPGDVFEICPSCKRKRFGRELAAQSTGRYENAK